MDEENEKEIVVDEENEKRTKPKKKEGSEVSAEVNEKKMKAPEKKRKKPDEVKSKKSQEVMSDATNQEQLKPEAESSGGWFSSFLPKRPGPPQISNVYDHVLEPRKYLPASLKPPLAPVFQDPERLRSERRVYQAVGKDFDAEEEDDLERYDKLVMSKLKLSLYQAISQNYIRLLVCFITLFLVWATSLGLVR